MGVEIKFGGLLLMVIGLAYPWTIILDDFIKLI